jgi:hypothetical protein
MFHDGFGCKNCIGGQMEAEIILCRNCGRTLIKSGERVCGICVACVMEAEYSHALKIPTPNYNGKKQEDS